jgi:hypothetical protein
VGKTINTTLVIVGAILCLACTGLMPWAELGMTGALNSWPLWLRWISEHTGIGLPDYAIVSGLGADWTSYLQKNGADKNLGDYAYSLVIGLAMIAAAIGIAAVGREEAEEKTVLPVKK